MKLNFIFTRIKNLIINPRLEWAAIGNEVSTKQQQIKSLALPLIIIAGLCSVFGDFISMSREWFSASFVIVKALGVVGVGYAGLIISAQIINELTTSFNTKKDIHLTYKLVVNSLLVYYLVWAFVLLLPFMKILWVFQFFSAYLFWMGTAPLLETPHDNKAGFVVVSSLITAGVFLILNKILEQILLGVFGVGVAL
jgi:hypothetical protein